MTRTCPTCAVAYPPNGFYRRANGRLQHECKGCMKARNRANNRVRMTAKRAHQRQMAEYARAAQAGRLTA